MEASPMCAVVATARRSRRGKQSGLSVVRRATRTLDGFGANAPRKDVALLISVLSASVLLAVPALACPDLSFAGRACHADAVQEAEKRLAIQIERTSRALAGKRDETTRQFEASIRNFRVFLEVDCRVAGQMASANGADYEAARLACTAAALTARAEALKARL
jgi:hypothetical protein